MKCCGHGVISRLINHELADPFRRFKIPIVNLNDVHDACGLSSIQIDHRIRKYLGRSPQAGIRAVQLKRARELLAKTNMRLAHIARLVGFEHPEYLSVVFKRESGETPGEYRRRATAADPSHST